MQRLYCRRSLVAAAVCAGLIVPAAQAQLEEVVVTAQKREESVQDVPIAVTAFDANSLKNQQINTFGDFRFAVPNVTFQKGNFTNNNFSIRGIGNTVVAAGSDSGVEVSINEVPVLWPRLFETEFFDVQQIAVLRGPQGTLYGRNSTGGAVNMVTNAADPGGLAGSIEGEYGDYAHQQLEGMINIPLGDNFAVRFAGLSFARDGYTENIAPGGDDIDDRDQYAVRGAIHWSPTANDSFDLMASYFDEDSSRTRSQKQMCHNDPSGVYGCLPDKLAFEMVNPLAQLTGLLPSRLGILAPTPGAVNQPAGNPADLRKTALDFTPIYEADETLLTLRYTHEFDRHTLAAVAGYQDTSVYSLADYTMSLGQPSAPSPLLSLFPFTQPAYNTFFADGCLPISAPSKTGTGIIGGHIGDCTNSTDGYDRSNQETDQTTIEVRVSSNHDGMFNFLAGAFYMEAETFNEYWVIANGLDYFAVVFPSIPLALGGQIGVPGVGMVGPSYINRTNSYELETQAVFGELYFQLREDLKFTLGARYTDDTKDIDAVQTLLGNGVLPFGSDADFLAGKNTVDSADWQETTGRVVLDWTPDFDVTDATLLYASYSRGYKGGGFNPPIDRTLAINQGVPETFEPEFIDAYEVGMKNTLLGNRLQLNLSAFFYDYEGLQVSKIFNRTALNENTDAEISGFETELLFAPDQHWQFNANLSYLDTEIQDFESVDTRDPSAGLNGNGVTVLKDNSNASNCVLHWNGASAPVMNPVNDCAAPRDLAGNLLLAPGSPYTVDTGVPRDVTGNQLGNAPEWQFSAGAQYRFPLPAGYSLTTRVDYFWQEEMYARIFNQPVDRIEAWDIWNAQATLMSPGQSWFLRAFVKNINDDDNLVGQFVSDASSGLFTNVFLIEPRTYGLGAGYSF